MSRTLQSPNTIDTYTIAAIPLSSYITIMSPNQTKDDSKLPTPYQTSNSDQHNTLHSLTGHYIIIQGDSTNVIVAVTSVHDLVQMGEVVRGHRS